MSSSWSAELAATCSALGYFDSKTNKYYADSNTLETVKDLIRYLRRDDESHDIRRHLGETQVLQTDLLPLLKSYWEETDLFDVLLRLLVNLTSPALMLWHEEVPTEKTARNHYLHVEDHLQKYKQSFADEAVWAVLSTRLSNILETDFSERGEENSLIIERILILIRNVLYVPANPDAEKRPDNDASVHDQVLWALHQSGMLDIILFITSSATEQAYYMHALEILSFMLREQSATELANAALQRSQTEKMRDEAELLAVRHHETNQKQQKIKMYNGARHSRFGGTFVVKSMKSISDNELIYHKPLNRLDALNFDAEKKKPKTPKNRLPVQSSTSERRSAFSIRLFLKEFCIEFLNGAYNTLMYHVKGNLVRAKAQAHDESYYLWALRFFMEFNRCYKFEVKLVSETMSIQSFHYVQQQMEKYFDMLSSDKKKISSWARRLHLAVLAYRELLLTVLAMDRCPDGSVRDSAKVIKSNIFYVVEYRELIITLLVTFDEVNLPRIYLNDLIEAQHIFLRMFQSYCEKFGDVVVQKKAKAKRKKKKAFSAAADAASTAGTNLDALWDEVAPQLSAVLEGASNVPSDVVPFDAASDVPIDEQKSEAMKNIQRRLGENEFENALGLLRAAREVWPENDSFGSSVMAPEEELLALRDIFFADLGENIPRSSLQPQQDDNIEDGEDEENEEELEGWGDMPEANLKFTDFVKRISHPRVVRACAFALRNFEHNSVHTNHCIVKLLHRIAWDCKMDGMMFQASIFRTFQKIYALKGMPQFQELVKFATFIMRKFFKLAQTNPKIFMETLFWKSCRDAYEIEEGYGSYQEKSQAAQKAWTEIEEDELRRLFMEHQEKQITEDVVDWIVNNLIDNTRTRRGVLKKLKEMCLVTEYKKTRKSGISGKIPRQWGEDEEAQLRELYEQFKDAMDPLGCIMDRLAVRRPKNRIVEKLLVMGLIQDKKEVRKKRAGKSQGPRAQDASDNSDINSSQDSESDESDSDDNNSGTSQHPRPQNTQPKRTQNSRPKKSSKTTNKKGARTQPAASTADLIKLLKNVAELSEALEWLRESFQDVADDLEENADDTDEDVPLVAILEPAVAAMENREFLKLLQGFGVKEPADEQETHWRIPSHLTVTILRHYCNLITNALENKLPENSESIEANLQHENLADSSDEDAFDRIRRILDQPNKKPEQSLSSREINGENDDDRDDNPSRSINTKFSSQKAKGSFQSKPKRVVDSDDEYENNETVSNTPKTKRMPVLDGDDDHDEEITTTRSLNTKLKRSSFLASDNDTDDDDASTTLRKEKTSISKSRITALLDSDDETNQPSTSNDLLNDDIILRKSEPKRKLAFLESDDDDDDDGSIRVFEELPKNNDDVINESQENHKQKGKRAILDSASEDDAFGKENLMVDKDQNKRGVPSDSEQSPKRKRTRVLASDDDDD